MLKKPLVLTVTQLNRYLKAKFEEDSNLSAIFLTGEISNFTNHYKSGHLYFSLKDEKAAVRAVMFSGQASRLRFLPKDGMKVLLRGRVSVYEATGQYQIYVEDMQPDGLGALHLAYEQLKEKLEREGLFAAERKKPLPPFPERIGVITSPTGAAVQDILQILARRYPLAEVILAPVLVQGDGAASQIVAAIETCNRLQCADVLIVGRGGGSMEDLWAFNEEAVARAVAASEIPIISAVGHETDFTICDFAADLRAPTPSAAAELAVPDQRELLETIRNLQYTMTYHISRALEEARQRLDFLANSRYLAQPKLLIADRQEAWQRRTVDLQRAMAQMLAQKQTQLASLAGKLDGLSPLKILQRGFVLAADAKGVPLTTVAQAAVGESLALQLSDGEITCTVDEIRPQGGGV